MMLEDILLKVTKPARYIGSEWNSVTKNPQQCLIKIALCFPEIYEIGMSNLGLRVIYQILNNQKDILCERAFAPWSDMEYQLRENKIPLFSLENRIPLNEFDVIGFSLSSEMTYTNVLNMLDLAGVPLFAKDRKDSDPLVIAGGFCTVNPRPMSCFFDAMLIGDGEEAVLEIAELIKKQKTDRINKKDVLKKLSRIEGVYVPEFSTPKIKKRIVESLDDAFFPTNCMVPNVEAVHDRISIEVMRGCPFRCKFCQAQAVYYPKRQRSKEKIVDLAKKIYKKTGYDEISLVSLSSGSHTQIKQIISSLVEDFKRKDVCVSLPSLRVEKFLDQLPQLFSDRKRTGLTFAPEAGTQRLRDFINKKIDEKELLDCAEKIYRMGWKRIKLYFMIGLPTEEIADLDGIVDLAYKISNFQNKLSNRPGEVTLSIGNFIPKPHTPFERRGMNSIDQLLDKQNYLRSKIRRGRIKFNFQDPRLSTVEALLSRGDHRLGRAIWRAWQKGCKFDGWREHFNWNGWSAAFSEEDINIENIVNREIGAEEDLPWSWVDMQAPIGA